MCMTNQRDTKIKMGTLKAFFKENKKIALGFSGGVDSVYLLFTAKKYGADVRAYFVKTPFQPAFEYDDAVKAAQFVGVELNVIELDILSYKEVAANPESRCYYCKRHIFDAICRRAAADGLDVIIDGTNASDNADERPGMRALKELEVRSPLRECGLTKSDIRRLSKDAGLFTWNKPSYACLATRIPTGERITRELLGKIEKSEDVLSKLGFSDFRIRYFHGAARIQLKDFEMQKALEKRAEIIEKLQLYFNDIFIDMRSG